MAVEVKIGKGQINVDLIDKYELVDSLGKGGEGHVLDVRDFSSGKHFAMKARFAVGDSKEYQDPIDRLLMARDAFKDIGSHDHIIELVDWGNLRAEVMVFDTTHEVPVYFNVYEKIELRDDSEELGPYQVVQIGADIASALSAVHEKGWVHRDVKPKNILIDKTLHAKLSDFGVAYKMTGFMRRVFQPGKLPEGVDEEDTWVRDDGYTVGTPTYMSPEQTEMQYVGPASDIYNLGASLYEMLAGRFPNEGRDVAEVMFSAKHRTPLQIRSLSKSIRQRVPEELDMAVMRMLCKDPKGRKTASEVEAELREMIPMLREMAEKPPRKSWSFLGFLRGDDSVRGIRKKGR